MRFLILMLIMGVCPQDTRASDSIPGHLLHQSMPEFMLLKADSTYFFSKDLSRKKQTVVILFSPECDHCRKQTTDLQDSIHLFKNTQFLMSTTLPFAKMKDFYREYGLEKDKKQLIVGRDILFFLSKHYQSHYLPFVVVYDTSRKVAAVFEGNVSIKQLLELTN